MKTIVCSAILLAACRTPDPDWAKPSGGRAGEPTIAGEPVKIPVMTAPVIDGKLDDAAWSGAATLGPLIDPRDGRAVEKSQVAAFARVGWDANNLYVGVVVHDAAPVSQFGRDDVDPHIWGSSSGIELMMQPGDAGDNRDYYELQVDVNGAVFDSHFDDYNKPISGTGALKVFGHQDWSSHVTRAIYASPRSFWSVELAVPWSSFAGARLPVPPKPGDLWRINLYSFRDGQRQALAWSPLRGLGNFHKSSQFGRIQF